MHISRVIRANELVEKFRTFHSIIDGNKKIILDKEYAELLEIFEDYFYKYIELSIKIKKSAYDKVIKQFKDYKEIFNRIESKCVLSHMRDNMKDTIIQKRTSFEIIFEEDLGAKACCNTKCLIF